LNVQTPTSTPSVTNKQTDVQVVIEVIDGDTIKIASGQHVRLIGIDTPELHHPKKPVQCFAQEAKERLQKLVLGRKVRVERDVSQTDRYKRLLRYVYVGEDFVNEILVKEGYARAATFPPDVKYSQLFRLAEEEARLNNRGLWRACDN
jgi:micrococcal nuclease